MDNFVQTSVRMNLLLKLITPFNERNKMENSETKLISVEFIREPITKLIQVDKNLNVDELMDEQELFEFLKEHFYEEIHDCDHWIEDVESSSYYSEQEPDIFVYENKDDSKGRYGEGFKEGQVVPKETKSIIGYFPERHFSQFEKTKNGGENLRSTVIVFLSLSKEETKKLWNKGDVKNLTKYFIKNKTSYFEGEKISEDDISIFQRIYDEKDNPIDIRLQDVHSYQRQEHTRYGEGIQTLKDCKFSDYKDE